MTTLPQSDFKLLALECRSAELADAQHDRCAYRELYLLTLGLLGDAECSLARARDRHQRLVDENRFLRAHLLRDVAA